MCIYFSERDDLTYSKKEHVFPAGLGGIAVLPPGFVSDQANEMFSPLEGSLMHNSLLSTPRALFGPGKRGSLNPKEASRSNVAILQKESGEIAFGYLSGRSSFFINTLVKSGNQFIFTVATNQHNTLEQARNDFRVACEKFEGKFVHMSGKKLSPSDWAFGAFEGKYYLALGAECSLELFQKQLKAVLSSPKSGTLQKSETHPNFDLPLVESDDTTRVYAKVAINVLAYMLGEDYINHERFRPIKDWIIGQKETNEFSQLPRVTPKNVLQLPEQCHWCLFCIHDGKLTAVVCFYNAFSRYFELADYDEALDRKFAGRLFGLICDWKNKREFTFDDWILAYANHLCASD